MCRHTVFINDQPDNALKAQGLLISLYLTTCLHTVNFSFAIFRDGQVRLVQLISLHDEQTVHRLRKIAWASVFHLKRVYICSDVYRKQKQKTEVGFPWRQTMNGNRRLPFQQMCPTMAILLYV